MIWIILGIIIAIITIVKVCTDGYNDDIEKVLWSTATILMSFLFSLLFWIMASGITSCIAEIDYKMISDTKIIALKDNQSINGRWYIMGGYVNEDLYYYYATETEFGYKTEKIKADNAYIKYTKGKTYIEKYSAEFKNSINYLFGVPTKEDRYIIYCPEGTVTSEFSVDLE